jgi:hypothetical protein
VTAGVGGSEARVSPLAGALAAFIPGPGLRSGGGGRGSGCVRPRPQAAFWEGDRGRGTTDDGRRTTDDRRLIADD